MRVLQLNIWGRRDPYEERAAMLRGEIGTLAPDVIALQEVYGTDDERNQAAELFGPLGYGVRFDPRPGRKDFEWGMAIAAGDELPPVIGGDFDATPDAASTRFLTGLQSLHGRSTHWIDAFAAAGDGSPGHTWSTNNPFMAPSATKTFAQPEHH